MAKVEIYTSRSCVFCNRAKDLLTRKGIKFTEYKVDEDEQARAAMADRAPGSRTVPQIFIDGRHVGGWDDLYALYKNGGLDSLPGVQP